MARSVTAEDELRCWLREVKRNIAGVGSRDKALRARSRNWLDSLVPLLAEALTDSVEGPDDVPLADGADTAGGAGA